jgi:hypothetical protein
MGCAPAGPARKVCLPPTPQRCQAKRSGAFRGPPARPAGSVGAVRRQLRDMHAVPTWRLSMMAKASGACSKARRWLTPTATSPLPYRRATSSRLLLQRTASSGQASGNGQKHARSEFFAAAGRRRHCCYTAGQPGHKRLVQPAWRAAGARSAAAEQRAANCTAARSGGGRGNVPEHARGVVLVAAPIDAVDGQVLDLRGAEAGEQHD